MAPPPSSSRDPPSAQDGGASDHLQAPVASPSSRPRSILNVSRPSALSPSLSSHHPLNQLSVSPSSQSIISNGARGAGTGASGNSGGYSALNRLKRVASNASIASSRHASQRPSAAPPPNVDSPTLASPVSGSRPESVTSRVMESRDDERRGNATTLAPPSALAPPGTSSESASSTIIKRPRSPATNTDTITAKQFRRKTWFGFGTVVDDDVVMEEAQAKAADGNGEARDGHVNGPVSSTNDDSGDVEMGDAKEEQQGVVPAAAAGPTKSWIPWRAPAEVNSTQESSSVQPSYTDTIRRYISGDSMQSMGWVSWPIWASEAAPGNAAEDGGKLAEEAKKAAEPEVEPPAEISATAAPSLLNRWWPSWRLDPSQQEGQKAEETEVARPTPTPAEQVKADALARLGAKDAVLNDATRSTWINYFSSRSAMPLSKVQDQDGGPEVMRIEMPSAAATPQGSTQPNAKGKAREKERKTDVGQSEGERKPHGQGGRPELDRVRIDPAPAISRPSTPLTTDKNVAQQVTKAAAAKTGKKGDGASKPPKGPPPPNLLLPSFDDTFFSAPRSLPPSKGMLEKTLSYLFNRSSEDSMTSRARKSSLLSIGAGNRSAEEDQREHEAQTRLPRMWSVVGNKERAATKGCKGVGKVTVIGVHGWFSQGPLRNVFGEPTGTSTKFATMMASAVRKHFADAGQALDEEQLSVIALEADGQVSERVNKSFSALLCNPKWLADVLASDVVFVAAHSQGSVVATHLLARLIEQRHLDARRTKIALLAMCGIHHGPFTHLRSSVASYYLNTFETPAAKELFEYQNSKSAVSMMYAAALRIVISSGVKLIYVASMDDQVVPLYSALNASASHPSILRAIFCDGAAFPRVDFLTNLLSFCVAVRNAGLSDHNLLTLLSASVAGSLYGGAGHSLVYEEPQVYSLAVRYLLEVTSPNSYPTTKASESATPPKLQLEPFSTLENAKWNSNPFALPWSLRGLLEDGVVRRYYDPIIEKLLRDYHDWNPTTKTLKDVQFRLEPMRLVTRRSPTPSASKL